MRDLLRYLTVNIFWYN